MSVLSKTDEVSFSEDSSSQSESAVLIDTNGFMIPVQFGIDIFSELQRLGFSQYLTVSAVIYELEKLSRVAKGNDKVAARIALRLSGQCKIIDDAASQSASRKISKYADDIIIESAVKHSIAVLTNDSTLRQKLMKYNVRVISMRQTNRLDFINQK